MKGTRLLKRLVVGLLAVGLLSLLAFWWRYGRSAKVVQQMPVGTNWLIDIDLRQIEQVVLWDVLGNPMSYWNRKKSDDQDEDDVHTPSNHVNVPQHLTVFVTASHPNIGLINPVSVDGKDFQEYVDTLVARQELELLSEQFAYDSKKHLFYFWNQDQVGIAFAEKEKSKIVRDALVEILAGENMKPIPKALTEKIKSGQHHIHIWRKQSELTKNQDAFFAGDFADGFFSLVGDIPFDDVFSGASNGVKTQSDAHDFVLALGMDLSLEKGNFVQYLSVDTKQQFRKWTNLDLDSLAQYWAADLSLEVPKISSKSDTIITYEFDDDFNKVEKSTVQNILAPVVNLHLASKSERVLMDYFKRAGVVKMIENQERFIAFPLLEMQALSKDEDLLLTTENEYQIRPKSDNLDFMNLEIDCTRYPAMLEYLPFQLEQKHRDLIKGLSLRARQQVNLIHVDVKLKLIDGDRNALGSYLTAE